MTKQTDKPENLNEALHRAMGRSKCQPVLVKRTTRRGTPNDYWECKTCGWSALELDEFPAEGCPPRRYDSDLIAAFELQAFVIEKVGYEPYVRAFLKTLSPDDTREIGYHLYSKLLTATAEQRALACYRALGLENSEGGE